MVRIAHFIVSLSYCRLIKPDNSLIFISINFRPTSKYPSFSSEDFTQTTSALTRQALSRRAFLSLKSSLVPTASDSSVKSLIPPKEIFRLTAFFSRPSSVYSTAKAKSRRREDLFSFGSRGEITLEAALVIMSLSRFRSSNGLRRHWILLSFILFSNSSSAEPYPVINTQGAPGIIFLISLNTSRPFIPGIRISKNTKSNFSFLASSRASWPPAAITAFTGKRFRKRLSKSRTTASSSTTKTFKMFLSAIFQSSSRDKSRRYYCAVTLNSNFHPPLSPPPPGGETKIIVTAHHP